MSTSDSNSNSGIKVPRPTKNTNLVVPKYQGQPLRYIYQLSATPYPVLFQGGMLLVTPYLSPQWPLQTMASNETLAHRSGVDHANLSFRVQGRLGPFARTKSLQNIGLSGRNALLFGAASIAGAWMIYDDDLESGSGFTAAWSALYLLVNGKRSVQWLKFNKKWPLLVSTVALTNTAIYGRRFLTGGFS